MRAAAVLASFAIGCGRIGFAVCTACGSSGGIERVQVAATGVNATSLTIPIVQSAGNFAIAAVYAAVSGVGVNDSFGQVWMSLPGEISGCPSSGTPAHLRLWYAQLTHDGTNTITVGPTSLRLGAFVVEYAGVSQQNPIDVASGHVAVTQTNVMDAGTLDTNNADLLVAAFTDNQSQGTMTPKSGWRELSHDDGNILALIEDMPVSVGSFTPTAFLPAASASNCWVGASVALRPQ